MSSYYAIVFCTLRLDDRLWSDIPSNQVASVVSEYKYLAESFAERYGSVHRNFSSDGYLFLFEYADAAVQFALRLVESWPQSPETLPDATKLPVVLLGRAGGKLESGRVLDYGGKPNRRMCSLFLAMMDKCGVHLREFGDSNERLAEV